MLQDYHCAQALKCYPPMRPDSSASPISSSLSPQPFKAQSPAKSTASYSSSSHYPTSTANSSVSLNVPKPQSPAGGGTGAAKTPQQRRNTCFVPGKCQQDRRHGLKVMYINDHHDVDPRIFCRQLGNPSCKQQRPIMHAWCAQCDKILCKECWGRSKSGYYEVTGRPQTERGKLGVEAVKQTIRSLGKQC